jgi:hypothetical protein
MQIYHSAKVITQRQSRRRILREGHTLHGERSREMQVEVSRHNPYLRAGRRQRSDRLMHLIRPRRTSAYAVSHLPMDIDLHVLQFSEENVRRIKIRVRHRHAGICGDTGSKLTEIGQVRRRRARSTSTDKYNQTAIPQGLDQRPGNINSAKPHKSRDYDRTPHDDAQPPQATSVRSIPPAQHKATGQR